MTLKRLILSVLTLFVAILVGSSLVRSLGEPQITNRLELYQTNLLLYAAESATGATDADQQQTAQLRQALLGEDPLKKALEQYESVRKTAKTDLAGFEAKLAQQAPALETEAATDPSAENARVVQLRTAVQKQQDLINQIDLDVGIIQAEQGEPKTALATWDGLVQRNQGEPKSGTPSTTQTLVNTAEILRGLWNEPPRLLPDAETKLDKNLEGWFRYVSLTRLYELQQRTDTLAALQSREQAQAKSTLVKLGLVSVVPIVGSLAGVGLLVFLLIQRLTRGKQSVLATNAETVWSVPWDWETIWQVLILGFFFVGQIAVPFLLSLVGVSFNAFGTRAKAIYALTYYLLMAGSGLLVLFLSVKPSFPLPEGWFRYKLRSNWLVWGIGGYLVALPLMIGVSLLNQQIWHGQGGSNPLLQIVLEEGDPVSLGIFLFTAAVAAPVFEETLFRGFLLPSLTRYVPVGGAIALSSLLFAIAHLSFSEVLPLTVLGAVLGFVYTRSRNLLAPILLHSLWNSITMIGLFILGSAD